MILTVTANAALDRVIYIDEFVPTTDMRSRKVVESVGGKGLDSSVVLSHLHVNTLALGFVAGLNGERLAQLLADYQIETDLIRVAGESRIAHVIVEMKHNRHSHITTPGYTIEPRDLEQFLQRYKAHLPQAHWVIAAGSLPAGVGDDFYCSVVEIAHRLKVPVMVDCAGAPMRNALPAQPDIIKMNRSEFYQTFGGQRGSRDDLIAAANAVRAGRQSTSIVITCGEDGILAITPSGSYVATSPVVREVNAAGAGDAVSASLAWQLSAGAAWPEALRWAAATSAAVVLTEGTADCRLEDVHRILNETTVQPLHLA